MVTCFWEGPAAEASLATVTCSTSLVRLMDISWSQTNWRKINCICAQARNTISTKRNRRKAFWRDIIRCSRSFYHFFCVCWKWVHTTCGRWVPEYFGRPIRHYHMFVLKNIKSHITIEFSYAGIFAIKNIYIYLYYIKKAHHLFLPENFRSHIDQYNTNISFRRKCCYNIIKQYPDLKTTLKSCYENSILQR